ncbi:MAG: hypothetical protein C4339_02040 [Nitrososphaerota archaeon]
MAGEERLRELAKRAGIPSLLDLALMPDALLREQGLTEEEVRELRALLRERHGKALEPLEPARAPPRLATGCAPIDGLLGGGFPRGELLGIVGERGVGKTTLALQAAALELARGPRRLVAYIYSSGGFRAERLAQLISARRLGEPRELLERLLVLRAQQAWQLFAALERLRRLSNGELPLVIADEVHGCLEAGPGLAPSPMAQHALLLDFVGELRRLCSSLGSCGLLIVPLVLDERLGQRKPAGYRFSFPLYGYLLLERRGRAFRARCSLTRQVAPYEIGEEGLK